MAIQQHAPSRQRTSFPSPYEQPAPEGAEDWRSLYPYNVLFQPERRALEEAKFWFCDSQHWPTVIKPFETIGPELSTKCLGQFNTRYFLVPPANGLECRIHQGYVYHNPVTVERDEAAARVPEFLRRAGYYFEHWDALLDNWKRKVLATIQELEALRFTELPDAQPYEEIERGTGLDATDALLGGYDRLLALCHRAWQHHFEFLNLGYAAYLDLFQACGQWFPGIPDQAVAIMVQGVDMELFRPDDELKRLAKLAVELDLDHLLTGPVPGPGQETLDTVASAPRGRDWLDAWKTARDPWFNFTSGNGFYADDRYWRDEPALPLGYIRDYVLRLRRGENVDRRVTELVAERDRITGEYAALLDPAQRTDFEAKLRLARRVYPYVENHNFYIEHWSMGVFWRKTRQLSALLHRAGFWPGENDMLYLTRDEARGALFDFASGWARGCAPIGPDHWPPEVERRRRIVRALASRRPEPALNRPPAAVTEPFSIMLWGITSERVRSWLTAPHTTGDLIGLAASPGRAEGPARIVHSPAELDLVRDGEILVAPVTAPSWAPVFGRIRATVTDIGGVMSHAAIVCREYSLPAVTGTGSASTRIRTGQRIRVDGTAGTVTLLD
ncbi:PEP-utilizing enzyme [Streptomyces sp. NBC_01314]|uniref:PEP-utilizing enzyme n=1 Tax=Streptomyces sp. NBC_01314 TaxID=2903821 RepID=UPI00308563F0|nr:PEP-utilizing enzyme [Streptomyces sp. NBC_01314]